MSIIFGDNSVNGVWFGGSKVLKIYYNQVEVFSEQAPPPPPAKLSILSMGDSTIAATHGGQIIPAYTPEIYSSVTSIAMSGDTVLGQINKFNALEVTTGFDVVVIQIGLNDMYPDVQTTATLLANYQNLINLVRSKVRAGCKIYISKMLPCKARWVHPDVATRIGDPVAAQQRWTDLNYAIMNTFTNVNGRISSHVPILDDGAGNLRAEYGVGDDIHENIAGRQVIANAWKQKLVLDGAVQSPP